MQRVDREGTRPERTIYERTDRGRVELRERVSRLLEHPEPDATLMAAALSFAGCLPSDRAAGGLGLAPARDIGRPPATRHLHLPAGL